MVLELTRLSFKAAPGEPGQPSRISVLVGPNNSGKSQALRDIADWAAGGGGSRLVIDELDVSWPPDLPAAEELLRPFATVPLAGEVVQPGTMLIAPFRPDGSQQRLQIHRPTLEGQLQQHQQADDWLRQTLLSHFVARLDGRTRFALMDERPIQDLQLPPQHHLAALFVDDARRQQVRDLVAEAFPGRYFVIDPTGMAQFRVRMSDHPPSDPTEERGWDTRAKAFHARATPVDALSDGVVCFSGLVAAAVSLHDRILLVDEPEAFLHPPLARLLGASLAALADERRTTLIAATHSAEFLMGCIESGVETTIVRLTYEQQRATARVLRPIDLRNLIADPLLRSTRALTGLFHRGVVVGESDHDRAFYDEINRRLVGRGRGTPDTFFTNAQNWQTTARVIRPLRQLGVPAAAVLDLDTLLGQKGEWQKFYEAAGLSRSDEASIEADRRTAARYLRGLGTDNHGKPKCKSAGLSLLPSRERQFLTQHLDRLGRLGLFIVEVGELESWLKSLNVVNRGKARWIVDIFRVLGSNPAAAGYVHPGNADVWNFIDKVGAWVADPNRAGMP